MCGLSTEISKLKQKLSPTVYINKTAIVLTDSKGKYLKRERELPVENNLQFWHKSGASTYSGLKYLRDNIDDAVRRCRHIIVYVWLGTCDLTVLDHKTRYINLRSTDNESVNNLIKVYRDFHKLIAQYPTVELAFLEIPIYSIVCWNRTHGHKHSEVFVSDDLKLEHQINLVNRWIRETNLLLRKHSPKFSCDIQNSRKSYRMRRSRFSYKFNSYYLDGIHPCKQLSKLWLLRIASMFKNDSA